jgi:type III secretion system YscQ/HrcQ family protein
MNDLAHLPDEGVERHDADAIAKIESRWKSALKKASHLPLDRKSVFTLDAQRGREIAERASRREAEWQPLQALHLRQVERELATQQHDWLVPAIRGSFNVENETVFWQLVPPSPLSNPINVPLTRQPLQAISSAREDGETAPHANEVVARLRIEVASDLLSWIPVPWQGMASDAKNTVLQISLAPLVESMGDVLNERWTVSPFEDVNHSSPTPVSEEAIRVGIAFRKRGVVLPEHAELLVTPTWLDRFMEYRAANKPAFSLAGFLAEKPELRDVALNLPISVGELQLAASDVRELAAGDVIFFANAAGSVKDWWQSPRVSPRIRTRFADIDIRFDERGQNVAVRGVRMKSAGSAPNPYAFDSVLSFKETSMSTSAQATTPSDAALADHLAHLPVNVSVEVAELSLPLHALAELAVGNTLALQKPLNEQMLTIRANGQAVAAGELVMLDGELGVRVRHLISRVAPTDSPSADEFPANTASSADSGIQVEEASQDVTAEPTTAPSESNAT